MHVPIDAQAPALNHPVAGRGRVDAPADRPARRSPAPRLALALALTAGLCTAQMAGGFVFGSLALLSDAVHMLADSAGLAIALAASLIAVRAANDRYSFGYRRVEVVAGATHALLLIGAASTIVIAALLRLGDPQPVMAGGVLGLGALGLAVNVASLWLLFPPRKDGPNLRGAYLEVLADTVGSVGVIVAALLIMATGMYWIDPAIALCIGLWMLPRGWGLLRGTGRVLLEGVPAGVALAKVRKAIECTPGVASLDTLRLWTSGADTGTCMLKLTLEPRADPTGVRTGIERRLRNDFELGLVVIQAEPGPRMP